MRIESAGTDDGQPRSHDDHEAMKTAKAAHRQTRLDG